MKKSVLLLTPVFDQGGTETYIVSLGKYLVNNGYSVIIVSAGGIREKEISNNGLKHEKVLNLRKKGILKALSCIIKISKIIRNNNINIIHSSSIYTLILANIIAKFNYKKHIKTVYTMHGGPNENVERTSKWILNKCVDSIIVLSQNAKDNLIKNGVKKSKLTVVYNGIEYNGFIRKNEEKDKEENKIKIVSIGRLTKQKGHKYLIEALSLLENFNYEVYIIGEGELKVELNNKIKSLMLENKVKLLGFRSNIYDYLSEADIFILPSLWDQCPISILEAMMFELPIIASNVNGIEEEIGETGILINSRNIEEIRKAIEKLILHPKLREEKGKAAKKRFLENFTLDTMGRNTVKVYEE